MKAILILIAMLPAIALAQLDESFEDIKPGSLSTTESLVGTWTAKPDHAEIRQGNARSGQRALRIHGGGDNWREVELALPKPAAKGSGLTFYAERWTSRGPFEFRIEAKVRGNWTEVWNGGKAVRVGGYHARADIDLPPQTIDIRFRSKAAEGGGVLIDDVRLEGPSKAKIASVSASHPVAPAFIRETFNPVTGLHVDVVGRLGEVNVEAFELMLDGTSNLADIIEVNVLRGEADPAQRANEVVATAKVKGRRVVLETDGLSLRSGKHSFWFSPVLRENADIDGRVRIAIPRILSNGAKIDVDGGEEARAQRIGYAVRLPGDDGSKSYRIPGLVESKDGTLIAVYDIRYNHSGDLPADIDVGVSRSTDGGHTWGPMIKAMSRDIKGIGQGIGDAAILVDAVTGRIWLAVLAAPKSGHPIWSSSAGTASPEKVGQFLLAFSDDDGESWSTPINITPDIKRLGDEDTEKWGLLFQGPGNGITLRDGTLVFPSQVWTLRDDGKVGQAYGVLVYSKDRGETWQSSKATTYNNIHASESQAVELSNRSIMFNARNEHRNGYRMVATTDDLGESWYPHPTDRNSETGLNEPTCQASLLRVSFEPNLLAFSNPATTSGRHSMTLRLSTDDGQTWPRKLQELYDSRSCYGYSSLAPVGKEHLAVLYEGRDTMYFLRFQLNELISR